MTYSTRDIQIRLAGLGYNPGIIDGLRGPKTIAAIRAFQKDKGLYVDGIVGKNTSAALFGVVALGSDKEDWWKSAFLAISKSLKGGSASVVGADGRPQWLINAYSDLGVTEIKGSKHTARILEYWDVIGQGGINNDETAWCAAGIGCWLEEAGIESTHSGLARSYGRSWGIKLRGPALGAIAVKSRSGSATYGHVTCVAGRTSGGYLGCLGANQGDSVCISRYSPAQFENTGFDDCGYFWPKDYPLPKNIGLAKLPLINTSGDVLSEA